MLTLFPAGAGQVGCAEKLSLAPRELHLDLQLFLLREERLVLRDGRVSPTPDPADLRDALQRARASAAAARS